MSKDYDRIFVLHCWNCPANHCNPHSLILNQRKGNVGRPATYKGWEDSPERVERQKAILQTLHDEGPQTQRGLSDLLGKTGHFIRRVLEPMIDEGKVGAFRRGHKVYYILGQDMFGEQQ